MMEAIWKSLTTRRMILVSFVLGASVLGVLWYLDPDSLPPEPYTEAEQPNSALSPNDDKPPPSDAERIVRLRRAIDEQNKYLEGLNKELNDPKSEYHKAEHHFQRVDNERSALRHEIGDLKASGKTTEASQSEAKLQEIETRWKQSQERFNLALKEHRTLQQSIDATTRQIQQDQQALARLTTISPSPSTTPAATSAPAATSETTTAKSPQKTTESPSLMPVPSSPLIPTSSTSTTTTASSSTSSSSSAPADHISREVERAREEAKRKEDAAQQAESQVETINKRIEVLNEDIRVTKQLLDTRRKESEDEQKIKGELEEQLKQKTAAKAPEVELKELTHRIELSGRRFQKELEEVHVTSDHLHDLQKELSALQAAQIRALRQAAQAKQAADDAEEKIVQLQNPFRPRNIAHWLLHHGPRLLLIALGMFAFYRLSRAFSRRIMQFMAQGTSKRGTKQDRENRAQTLAGVFNSALSMLVLGGGSLMMLDEVGIPIVPLMGGAAVLGLAVAFGAQNLIKDYFSGFMVLLEDQYGINDVVRIGSISGLVEHISLRTTVLRDLEGVVHFIPHGTITTVSNQTHGWSRALFDVGIDYKEDIDHVMAVLLDLGRELRQDPSFSSLILDDPEMLGVDNLADSSVIIKFFIKTRPLQQWTIKREMLRRIKKRFGELGIEIPYPHQTVHHRYDVPPPPGLPDAPPFQRVA
jgi:small-conductance mechanosensitive channel/predicted  nucleic acid-binding Zn-ribbon protein